MTQCARNVGLVVGPLVFTILKTLVTGDGEREARWRFFTAMWWCPSLGGIHGNIMYIYISFIEINTYIYIYIYVCMYIYMYIYIYIYIYISLGVHDIWIEVMEWIQNWELGTWGPKKCDPAWFRCQTLSNGCSSMQVLWKYIYIYKSWLVVTGTSIHG